MTGLVVTAAGWGLFVFGLDRVPISAARMITGGSYVVLALFSAVFLRTPLSTIEWGALAAVTCGIVLLGLQEGAAAASVAPPAARVILGVGCIAILSLCVALAPRLARGSPRAAVISLFAFAALSGLLGSAGDLLTKVFLAVLETPGSDKAVPLAASAAGFIAFYLSGFYMLSRAYQVGTVVGGVVVSDFFGRAGALFLGALSLSEPVLGAGAFGLERALGFLLVLGGSLLLGRFSAAPAESASVSAPP